MTSIVGLDYLAELSQLFIEAVTRPRLNLKTLNYKN